MRVTFKINDVLHTGAFSEKSSTLSTFSKNFTPGTELSINGDLWEVIGTMVSPFIEKVTNVSLRRKE